MNLSRVSGAVFGVFAAAAIGLLSGGDARAGSDYLKCGATSCTSCSSLINSENGHGCKREMRGAGFGSSACTIHSDQSCSAGSVTFDCKVVGQNWACQKSVPKPKAENENELLCNSGDLPKFQKGICKETGEMRSTLVSLCREKGFFKTVAVCCPDNLCIAVPAGGNSGAAGSAGAVRAP